MTSETRAGSQERNQTCHELTHLDKCPQDVIREEGRQKSLVSKDCTILANETAGKRNEDTNLEMSGIPSTKIAVLEPRGNFNGDNSQSLRQGNYDWQVEICRTLSHSRAKEESQGHVAPEDDLSLAWKSKPIFVPQWLILFFPLGAIFLPGIGTLLAYVVASKPIKGVHYQIPFISDLGDERPESSIFSMGIMLGCCCVLGIVLVRYVQIAANLQIARKTNFGSLIFGFLMVIGMITVSSFQLSSNFSVHIVGALLYFGSATIYCGIQAYITYLHRKLYGHFLCYARTFATMTMFVCGILFGTFLQPSLEVHNRHPNNVGQGAEWAMAAVKMLYMTSFWIDFRNFSGKFELLRTYKSDSQEQN